MAESMFRGEKENWSQVDRQMRVCLLKSFILNLNHGDKYSVSQINCFILRTHTHRIIHHSVSILKSKLESVACDVFTVRHCFVHVHKYTLMPSASSSKAFKIKTLCCLVCDVLCIYKSSSHFQALARTQSAPTSHLLAQREGGGAVAKVVIPYSSGICDSNHLALVIFLCNSDKK